MNCLLTVKNLPAGCGSDHACFGVSRSPFLDFARGKYVYADPQSMLTTPGSRNRKMFRTIIYTVAAFMQTAVENMELNY